MLTPPWRTRSRTWSTRGWSWEARRTRSTATRAAVTRRPAVRSESSGVTVGTPGTLSNRSEAGILPFNGATRPRPGRLQGPGTLERSAISRKASARLTPNGHLTRASAPATRVPPPRVGDRLTSAGPGRSRNADEELQVAQPAHPAPVPHVSGADGAPGEQLLAVRRPLGGRGGARDDVARDPRRPKRRRRPRGQRWPSGRSHGGSRGAAAMTAEDDGI